MLSWRRFLYATCFLTLLLAGTILATISHDNSRKAQLDLQLLQLGTECDHMGQSVSDQESALESMQQRLDFQHAQLNEYNAGVQGYMLDHKMAVAALAVGVGGLQVASDNTYSQDATQAASAVAEPTGLWAVNNMDEVSDVLKNLNQADGHVRGLKADFAQTASAIEQEQQALQASQEHLQALNQQRTEIEQELNAP